MHLAAHGVEAALATAVLEVPRTRPADPILGIRDILLAKEAAKTNAMMDAPPRHMAVAGSSEAPCPVDSSSQPDGSILAISMQHRAISMRHDAITMRAVATAKRAQAEQAAAAAASALFAAKAAEAAAAAALSEAEAVGAAAVDAEMALLERREGSETSLASSAFRHLDRLDMISFVLSFDEGFLDADDALATALVCRPFYEAVCKCHPRRHRPGHQYHGKRFLTRRRGAVRSVALATWATEECWLPLSPRLCKSAAQIKQLDVLVWAVKQGCECDVTVCEAAAAVGDLTVLEWLWTHNAPMDTHSATLALWAGHRDAFNYLTGGPMLNYRLCGQSVIVPKVKWQNRFMLRIKSEADVEGRRYLVHFLTPLGLVMRRYCNEVGIGLDAFQFELDDGTASRKVVGYHQFPHDLRIDTQRAAYPQTEAEFVAELGATMTEDWLEHVPILWAVEVDAQRDDSSGDDSSSDEGE